MPEDSQIAIPSSLREWLCFINKQHNKHIDMGLDRVGQVYQQLNIDLTCSEVITITGTNGKGSTARIIELAALALGKSVAVYSSPHLLEYPERIRINGSQQPEESHCQAFSRVNQARQDTELTFFEFATLAALVMIAEAKADVAILEVGLGGDTDAVNIVDADLAIITSIALDHQEWLGDSRESVAKHKAGIFRRNGKAIVGDPSPPANLVGITQDLNLDVLWRDKDFAIHDQGQSALFQFQNQPLLAISTGTFYPANIATALAATKHLNWPLEQLDASVLLDTKGLPGRWQVLATQPLVIADVAHNPHAAIQLADRLSTIPFDRLFLVVAMLQDKDIGETLAPFTQYEPIWHFASLQCARGASAEVVESALSSNKTQYRHNNVADAFNVVMAEADAGDCVLIFGSFVTVAEILQLKQYLTMN